MKPSNFFMFSQKKSAKHSDKKGWANSVDPDQTALKEQFDQGLHCLPFYQYF